MLCLRRPHLQQPHGPMPVPNIDTIHLLNLLHGRGDEVPEIAVLEAFDPLAELPLVLGRPATHPGAPRARPETAVDDVDASLHRGNRGNVNWF